MENKKRELVGKVVSAANDKTITVLVETYKKIVNMVNVLNILKNMLAMMKKMLLLLVTKLELLKLDHYLKQNVIV